MSDKDAWEQQRDLTDRFVSMAEVRYDLVVWGDAIDRSVKITDQHGQPIVGPRNISTLRELAQALEEAADFVEDCNPKWARNARRDWSNDD